MRRADHEGTLIPMSLSDLKNQIRHLIQEKQTSMRRLSMEAGLGATYVRDLMRGDHEPSYENLRKIAAILGVSVPELYGQAPNDSTLQRVESDTIHFPIVGYVQAGLWLESVNWPENEWQYRAAMKPDDHINYYGLIVRGDSMSEAYPPDTILICVPIDEYLYELEEEDHVIVERHENGIFESTVKEIVRDDIGRVWLRPRSKNPSHQAIPWPETETFDDGGAAPVRVTGVVVADFRARPKRARKRISAA